MTQHLQVTYLGCVLDNTFSGEPMALKALNKQSETKLFTLKLFTLVD